MCVTGLHLALHPTQALGRLIPAAALPHSAPTLATPPSGAPSVEAALGNQERVVCMYLCVCISLHLPEFAPTGTKTFTSYTCMTFEHLHRAHYKY